MPERPPASSAYSVVLLVVGVLAGTVLATWVKFAAEEDVVDATTGAACRVTGCSGLGMALAGWLLMVSVLGYGTAFAWRGRRAGWIERTAWVAGSVALFVWLVPFVPTGDGLADRLTGPGGEAMAGGIVVGLGTLGAFVVLLAVAVTLLSGPRALAVPMVLVVIAGGVVAAVTAGPGG